MGLIDMTPFEKDKQSLVRVQTTSSKLQDGKRHDLASASGKGSSATADCSVTTKGSGTTKGVESSSWGSARLAGQVGWS